MRSTPLHLLLIGALLLGGEVASAQESRPVGPYARLSALLQRYVDSEGSVDYATWKQKDEATLRTVVADLAKVEVKGLSGAAKKAYWINVYNALTLQAILEFYPLKSIKDKSGEKYDVWKHYLFGPDKVSLNAIEHEILRPMGDPRIHSAIVCASKGCPPLRSEAYLPSKLEEQLDDNVRVWLSSPTRGLKLVGKTLHLSQIFFWFGGDFEGGKRADHLAWISRYVDAKTKAALSQPGLKVKELDWDWALNAK